MSSTPPEVMLSHQIRASRILNKHVPELSGNHFVICHLAETLAHQESEEIERLNGEVDFLKAQNDGQRAVIRVLTKKHAGLVERVKELQNLLFQARRIRRRACERLRRLVKRKGL